MAQLDCSVIIVSYYTGDALFECLSALVAEQSSIFSLELIVVDNGNTAADSNRLAEMVEQEQIILLTGQGNIGFAAGCNLGVAKLSTDTVLLLNPDCIACEGVVRTLYECKQQHDESTVVSGWLVNPDGSEQRGLRRNLLTPLSLSIEMLKLDKLLPILQPLRLNLTHQPVTSEMMTVKACSGACMMLSKSFFLTLNGMDEGYFLHVEDLDFCRRIHQLKGSIMVYTKAVFSHYQGTSSMSNTEVEYHKRNGFIRYFSRYHRMFWMLPMGWLLRLAIELKYLSSKKGN